MKHNSKSFIKLVVDNFVNDRGAKRKHTAKEYESMLNDVFEMLSEKITKGYIVRPPYDFGEFSMNVLHNYVFSDKNPKAMNMNGANRYFSDLFFVNFNSGSHPCMVYYTFKMNDYMKDKIRDKVRNGERIFAYEKERQR